MTRARVRRTATERRQELAEAAARAFHREGFHRVTIAGVATSVGVTAPAVYRHFANKNALLAGAVETGLDEIEAAVADAGDRDAVLENLTRAALHRPDFWTLLQREMRHLDDAAQQQARARFRAFTASLGAALSAGGDPEELRVMTALAVLASPSAHPTSLPTDRAHALLAGAAAAVCVAPLPSSGGGATAREERHPASRGEEVLATAIRLFHRRGYAAVSLDDIGAAVGMAGPSIYHHWASKADLLVAAVDRVLSGLPAAGPDVAPKTAVRAYVDLALREREALGVSVTERIGLPGDAAARIGRHDAEDLAGWVAMLRASRPALDGDEAALLVHAARAVVHDVVRIGRLYRRPGVADELEALALAVLYSP
ncbi:TetR/AcrR family transcriptional regulator [Actinomycetospora aeridis]|uniref:TetR/AcrR family transcriptional regulator n=1 Tax=Actinomycetospora aeridis TaxID=3129231 RepID=A0ABU8N0E3_9PSEU